MIFWKNKRVLFTGIVIVFFVADCENFGFKKAQRGVWKLAVKSQTGHIEIRPAKKRYMDGEKVTLIAHPDSGFSFLNWFGDIYDIHSVVTITMNSHKKITAGYVKGEMGSVNDIDGFTYRTLKIGDLVWTIDNLRTTRFNDGTPIPYVENDSEWCNTVKPAYCFYNHTKDTAFQAMYGALYNWFAYGSVKLSPEEKLYADMFKINIGYGNLAPEGWRVATKSDWNTLGKTLNLLCGERNIPDRLYPISLITSNKNWQKCGRHFYSFRKERYPGVDALSNNETGFSALAGGARGGLSKNGKFWGLNGFGLWWCTDETVEKYLYGCHLYPPPEDRIPKQEQKEKALYLYSCDSLSTLIGGYTVSGFSVRLVKYSLSENDGLDDSYNN